MSANRKHKPKRKRGQTVASLSGHTPYSVTQCMERLKAGRLPVRKLDVTLDFDDPTLVVDIMARRSPIWTEPVWFEGTLTTDTRLTKVEGAIKSDLRIWLASLLLSILPGLIIVLAAVVVKPMLFSAVMLVIVGALLTFMFSSIQYRRKLARILHAWLSDRLDI